MASVSAISQNVSIRRAIIVCALGYFIDVFDIQLFAVLRVPSLTDLGIAADKLTTIGGYILNAQMVGMVLGAFLWGWIGDRFGRIKALYGSILIYSFGTLACGFVHDAEMYGILRFVTGFGLAGETGAAVTLVSELMSRERRGWGVTVTGGLGLLGPVLAIVISWFLTWRETYIIAGCLGILLLILRIRLIEPSLFAKMNRHDHQSGSLRLLVQPKPFKIFMCCIFTGMPTLFSWFVLNFFSAEFSRVVLKPDEPFNQKLCLLLFFFGTSCGALSSGALSQFLRSRRKALVLYLAGGAVVTAAYLILGPQFKIPVLLFYTIYYLLGVSAGCWLMLTMVASEHFGTNIRATTTILVTNLMRGSTIIMIFVFQTLQGTLGLTNAALIVGATLYGASFPALRQLRETHGLDLDYVERLEKPLSKTSKA